MADPRRTAGPLLFAAVAALYAATYSSVPTSDGYSWVSHIERGDLDKMLPAYHALPMYLIWRLGGLLARAGHPVAVLGLIQGVNALLAATSAVLQYAVIRTLGGSALLGWLGGALLALSFACWYFANGELHHFPLVVLLAIFFLLARARARGAAWGAGFPVGLGALNALAIMLHQESVIFGFAAVTFLWVGRPWREGFRDAVMYTLSGSLATALLAVATAVFLRGAASAGDFWRWFLWIFYAADQPQPYTLGGPVTIALKVLKGQLTALVLGTQVATDAARDRALLGWPVVTWLLAATAAAYGLMAWLVVDVWRRRRRLPGPLVAAAAASAVWIIAYVAILHWWFWPTAPEYYIGTLPPLVLLLMLGPIAAEHEERARAARRRLAAAAAALVALTGAMNFAGGLLPWYRFGQFEDALASGRLIAFRPGDLFVSSESSLDQVFAGKGRHLALKEVFSGGTASEGFAAVEAAIDGQLARGERVFAWNLVPAPFTLLGLNQAAARRGAPALAAADFAAFRDGLFRRHRAVPALSYWEEATTPLYLFGHSAETLWELERRAGDG